MMATASQIAMDCHHAFGSHSVGMGNVNRMYPVNANPAVMVNRCSGCEP